MQLDPIQWLIVGLTLAVVLVVVLVLVRRRTEPEHETVAPGRLGRIRGIGASLHKAWGSGVGADTWESIQDVLLMADVGVAGTSEVVERVRKQRPESYGEAQGLLAVELKGQFGRSDRSLNLDGEPAVVLVVGVNGSGKTTTIAKLAKRFQDEGRSVILGAADTFRAAAADQLVTWGDRLGVRVVRGSEGADPASVVFDTLAAARAETTDVVIVDTAGRLHGKKNLMDELGKIHRVASGGRDGTEVLLVLDASAGQNGLVQVREFAATVPLSGVVLTKLDGTARGGIVIAVEKELGVPVKFVGLGEALEDLEVFDPDRFIDELLERS